MLKAMRMAALSLVCFLLPALPAAAQDTPPSQFPRHAEFAERLDQLFGTLHSTQDLSEAKATETKIRAIWSHDSADNAVMALAKASLAMQVGELDVAEPVLDKLVADYPDFSEAWNRRATLYFMQGRFAPSLADIEKVLALEPRHFGALSGKGAILQAQGKKAEALVVMKEALAIDPFVPGLKDAVQQLEKTQPEL